MIRIALFALFTILSSCALAHSGGTTGVATVTVSGESVRFHLTLPDVPPGVLAEQMRLGRPDVSPDYAPLIQAISEKIRIESDGKACAASEGQVVPPSAGAVNLSGTVTFKCPTAPGELRIRDDLPDVLGADHHTIALIVWTGGSHSVAFGAEMRDAKATIGKSSGAQGAGSFFVLGIGHILTGYDHLLFLLVLILRGGGLLQLLKIVTAFTVAHTVTLGLAVFDVVVLPGTLVEAVIALSIAYVAAENLFPKYAISRRWTVSFLFGLVHGFGFSSVLKEIGLPKDNLLLSLLNFNLGVEVGQAAVVLLLVPILMRIRQRSWEPKLVMGLSAIVLVVGLVLFVERVIVRSA
ncbi:MAG TPA: HupE/UreJ family protein [Burkholderiales bacterium]